jgi:uncharacterized membrane protein YhaH (DUF805 family)
MITSLISTFNPYVALAVCVATIVTDAAYVMFTASVASRHRLRAANWSGIWYLLSAFAVINYTANPVYVVFAAIGSWIGAYTTLTFLKREQPVAPRPGGP